MVDYCPILFGRVVIDPMETEVSYQRQCLRTIHLLRLLHGDYRQAGEELRAVASHFSQREAATERELEKALDVIASGQVHQCDTGTTAMDRALGSRSTGTQEQLLCPVQCIPSLVVCCLGMLEVRVDTRPIRDWHSQKAKSLLGLLLERRGRPLPREVLMEALWPGADPMAANNNLKSTARALRQVLGPVEGSNADFSWLLYRDGCYMLNPNGFLWTDVDQFEFHWRAARRLEKEGKQAEAIQEYEAAELLYGGDYLEDNPYEEWTTFRREALKDTYLAVLQRVASYAMQQSDYVSCINSCQKILEKDRCREDAYQLIMCCHSRLGQRSRAIGWFRICQKTMKEELDLHPDTKTTHLYEELLRGRPI